MLGSWALTNTPYFLYTTPGYSGEFEIFMYGGLICHPSQTGKTRQMQSICSADDIYVRDGRN